MKLYSAIRSSAAYRTRIAFQLKGLDPDLVLIDFANGGHATSAYRAVNPQMRVPSLETDSGDNLVQSLAIIEYLDEVHPQPPLLPQDPAIRAKARAVAQIIACDIHPLNNVGVLNYIRREFAQPEDKVTAWYHTWVLAGFAGVENLLGPAPYCFGHQITIADICLVPQVANARRLGVPLDAFPKIVAADAACATLEAFERAKPENQPGASV